MGSEGYDCMDKLDYLGMLKQAREALRPATAGAETGGSSGTGRAAQRPKTAGGSGSRSGRLGTAQPSGGWANIVKERPLPAFGSMTPKMTHLYNRQILLERHPLKGESMARRRPKSAPAKKDPTFSPLDAYVESKHPIEIFDGGRTNSANLGLSKINEKIYPSWTLGVRLRDPKSREVRPGPCQYEIAEALDHRSQAVRMPHFTIGIKTPGYLDKPPESGSDCNIGVAHADWDNTGKRGYSFGVRHKHLDFKPKDVTPAPNAYNIAKPPEIPKKVAAHYKKYPKLGQKLKSRRSIDRAIGIPEPPGPGLYEVRQSVIGTRNISFGQRHRHLDPKYNDTPPASKYDPRTAWVLTQARRAPAAVISGKPFQSPTQPRQTGHGHA